MKLYPNLVTAIISGLNEIFIEKKQSDKVVEILLKSNSKWGSRDRRFIADSIYSVVRWYRLYHEILGHKPKTTTDWWSVLGIHWTLAGETLPDFKEFETIKSIDIISRKEQLSAIRAIKESIPDWLDELGEKELGTEWSACLSSLNEQQKVNLRINTIKTNRETCLAELKSEGIEVSLVSGNCLELTKRAKLNNLSSFKNGYFEIQDEGSQLIAPFLKPKPNSVVIDACAGAGGKSLHLAAIMKNKGEILSMDIHEHKLNELNKRKLRAGATIISTALISDQNIQKLKSSADYLLLDVPCSGLGVLKRNPGAKWKLTPEFISDVQKTQQEILQRYSQMVKRGGKILYATCSILPSENSQQVTQFLASEAGKLFKLVEEKTILPQNGNTDGFYMALLEKAK